MSKLISKSVNCENWSLKNSSWEKGVKSGRSGETKEGLIAQEVELNEFSAPVN